MDNHIFAVKVSRKLKKILDIFSKFLLSIKNNFTYYQIFFLIIRVDNFNWSFYSQVKFNLNKI